MAFINEFISDEDWKKYNIQEIEDNFKMGNSSDDSWTIDKENNMFLKNVASSRIDDNGRTWTHWVFFWKDDLYAVTTEVIDSNEAKRDEDYWVHKKIRHLALLNNDSNLDKNHQSKIMPDLGKALLAYKGGGVYSSDGGFDMKLELDLVYKETNLCL